MTAITVAAGLDRNFSAADRTSVIAGGGDYH
jgi:hypothetical protein